MMPTSCSIRTRSVKRGELYLIIPLRGDPRRSRVYLVVSRQGFVDTPYSTLVGVPVYSRGEGLTTEVPVGPEHGLKHTSFVRCDEVTSIPRERMQRFVGALSEEKMRNVNRALAVALDIDPDDLASL